VSLSEVCIRRPVLATVMTLILLIVGVVSFTYLSVRHYPNVETPVVSVIATYDGASPQIVETLITKPLEAALAGVEGLDYMKSTSEAEQSYIQLFLKPNRSLDAAAADVRDKISRVSAQLPDGVRSPMIKKAEADASPILYLALYGKGLDNADLYHQADKYIKNELESIPGVASIDISGGTEYVMHIWLDKARMSAHNVTAPEVLSALKRQNINTPAGRIQGDDREFHVTTNAMLKSVEDFDNVVVAHTKSYLVRLKDVGKAEFSSGEERNLAMFNDQPAVAIGIVKKSVSNPVEIARSLEKMLPDIRKTLPKGMEIDVAFDKTVFIEQSIQEVYWTLGEATICVLVVILMFLWSFRAAAIPLVTIPVSLISTFMLLYVFGFSINVLTLLAIVLAIGLVVDDAIVMLENIYRHIEKGMAPFEAAIKGSKEITFSVIAMTLTLAAVYAPIALSQGTIGKLFTEFALTLAGAVVFSGFVALTLSPMMCARMLKPHHGKTNIFDKYYFKVEAAYKKSLAWALQHRLWISLFGTIFSIAGLFVVLLGLKSEVAPREDQGVIYSFADANPLATLSSIKPYVDQTEDVFRQQPEVIKRLAILQVPNSMAWNLLKPWGERSRSSMQIVEDTKSKLRDVPGVAARSGPGRPLMGAGGGNNEAVQFVLQTTKSFNELYAAAGLLERALRKTGVLSNLLVDHSAGTQQISIEIDRDKAQDMGVDVHEIGETIDAFISGRKAGRFNRDREQFDVRLEVTPDNKREPYDLNNIYVKSRKDEMVPLSNLVKVKKESVPVEIQHYNQLRSVTFSADLGTGYSLGEGVEVIQQLAETMLPDSVRTSFSGSTQDLIEARYTMLLIFALALAFIYLIMAAQFESFTDPFIIMFSVPLSLSGAVIVLKCTGGTLNVYTQIGLVTLIGLITKHGILIVDFANERRRQGKEKVEAVFEATLLRLRPILMTTFAMVLGALPLVWAVGAGAESRHQIGWVILGGMSIGTLFTLYVVPVVYSFFSRKHIAPL